MNKKRNSIVTKMFFLLLVNIMITSFITIILYISIGGKQIGPPHENELGRVCIFIIGLVVQFIFSKIVVQRILEEIIEFNNAIKKVAKGDFNVKLEDKTNSIEIYEIVESFNIMTEELANTEMFRSDFISNVSHEFKTPLAAIDGYATLLQKENITEENRKTYINKILKNTKRLSTLTGNILSLSNLENNNIIKKEKFSLDEQIREVILLFEKEWTNKILNLDIELEEVFYLGSRELLEQVWQNIIGNAVKFSENNGELKAKLIKEEKKLLVIISDSGIGMDNNTQKRIFEKFYQGDTSHASEGNGLGLNIAKKIIDLHGGSIEVNSKKGEGSIFKVILPI